MTDDDWTGIASDGKPWINPREPTEADRVRLRAWLDRPPPIMRVGWRAWFVVNTNGLPLNYLGTRSARTGPDVVPPVQRCGCEVCARMETAESHGEPKPEP